MILITGARSSGKKDYAKALGYSEKDMSSDIYANCPVLYDMQDLVDPEGDNSHLLPLLLKKEVVITNEVGSGVIPVSVSERKGREAAGRLAVLIAKEAESVVRMVCGIPMMIK